MRAPAAVVLAVIGTTAGLPAAADTSLPYSPTSDSPRGAVQNGTTATGHTSNTRALTVIKDRAGDGNPDIKYMSVRRSNRLVPVVRVRVSHLDLNRRNMLRLWVDPYGNRQRPSYLIQLPINNATIYEMRRSNGWQVGKRLNACGLTIRLDKPAARVRLVTFRTSMSCFGDFAVKFAAETFRVRQGKPMRNHDWSPARRTLSRRFTL